jgi:hypothetical protein
MEIVRSNIINALKLVFKDINLYLSDIEKEKPEEERNLREYFLDIRERDMVYPLVKDGQVIGTNKKYYGTVVIFYTEKGKSYLVWRQEVVFGNATERRKDYTWKERACAKLMYESLGVFITVAENDKEHVKEYDLDRDAYITVPTEEEKEVIVKAKELSVPEE